MKVGAGFYRGMPLMVPKGLATRPTGAKVRAAVVNMLQAELAEARVLDLFAGSGGIGIEALSRGAASCVFVEKERAALQALAANCQEMARRAGKQGLPPPAAEIVRADVKELLGAPGRFGLKQEFDLVWADPPYSMVSEIAEAFLRGGYELTKTGGLLILEAAAPSPEFDAIFARLPSELWQSEKVKTYGQTMIRVFRKGNHANE